MIVTIASLKGGVGKTTSAIHIAHYLATVRGEKTLLLDNDPEQYAIGYAANGDGLAFDVLAMTAAMNRISKYDHVVIDTQARPTDKEIASYAQGCDLLIVPTSPAPMPLEGLGKLAPKLDNSPATWRALLTIVQPPPSKQGAETRAALMAAEIPTFKAEIPRAAAFEHASKAGIPVSGLGARGRQVWATYEAVGGEIDVVIK